MLIFTERQWRIFNRIRRKYKVSLKFLKYNMPNILKFIAYYGRRLHFVLKRSAERNPRNQSVVIKYNRLMRSLFDEAYRKRIKRRKRNIKQWSKRMVMYLRKTIGVKEYIITKKLRNSVQNPILPEDLTKQLKEQLELLKSGKRSTQLMDCSLSEGEMKSGDSSLEITETHIKDSLDESSGVDIEKQQQQQQQNGEFILNEKTGILESSGNRSTLNNDSTNATITSTPENTKSSANILDLLMSKVRGSQTMPTVKSVSATSLLNTSINSENDTGLDSGEEFLGFAEDENMRTPQISSIFRSREENSAFVSEALDEYFRENSLNRSFDIEQSEALPSNRKLRQANIDGLMTLNSKPPDFEMPSVPESLQKLRTVAERRHFLQKFSKNFKLAIINNEAAIYRELQRKIRQPKTKICSQHAMQANSSQMSFTRQGWQAASFLTTDLNKYFFQKLFLPNEKICVELHGVRGNNTDQYKANYVNKITSQSGFKCTPNCIDCCIAKCLKPISTYANRKKLCKNPFRAIFKPCPLSEKPRQPLLDDDEILLNGGGMTVVRLPTLKLEVRPELGKPLNDIAKRYLEYILPHEEITRAWAEFSTSTLQVPSDAAHSKKQKNIVKSFAFTVPYVNDRSHILVRRVVDRSEKIDSHFLSSPDEKNWSGLSFCRNIDKNDSTQVECASLLADMINSVAISCSENSFIKDDTEAMNKTEDCNSILLKEKIKVRPKIPITQKTTSGPKKSRLICELRRLNATIIQTNAQHKNDVKQCSKEFCALGCICSSLNNGYPLQQHCGKLKCMLQCTCKGSAPSKILRIETDGRSITTEDAYNMRLQATARLARIEKEFTSTVVVTENETLFINETEYDKKRRCTKVPKRYQDYRDTDNEYGRMSPVKSCSTTPLIDGNESRNSPAITTTTISEVMSGLQEPIYVKDVILAQLKHCSIPLIPFKDTHNMAVWCMIHQMYKCFCGGHALEGKRLVIEKEEPKKVPDLDKGGNIKPTFSSKAYYSFESTEEDLDKSLSLSTSTKRKNSEDRKSVTSEKPVDIVKSPEKSPKRHAEDHFLKNFFKDREYLGCSRFVPVPSRTYRSINRKRRNKILEETEYMEDTKSQLLLNEHIMRSVYYHKEKHVSEKIIQEMPKATIIKQEECFKEEEKSMIASGMEILDNSVTKPPEVEEDRTNLQLSEKKLKKSGKVEKKKESETQSAEKQVRIGKGEKNKESKSGNSKSSLAPFDEVQPPETAKKLKKIKNGKKDEKSEPGKPKRSLAPIDEIQPADKKLKRTEKGEKKDEKTEPAKPKRSLAPIDDIPPVEKKKLKKSEKLERSEDKANAVSRCNEKDMSASKEDESVPRISVCYSVKPQNERSDIQKLDMSADAGLSSFSEGLRENYNEVIKMLNSLVSRKMYDIDNALKRDSKIVPPSTENVLCVLQWKNFLGAFQDGLIYIWEVKMKTRTFLAATIQNMIPMVLGALAVISITQTPIQQLPLIGQMVMKGYQIDDESINLAVIMQGRSHYWYIKGFLQPNVANACLRPTPETHPELTKKINTLCSSLIKQRTRELTRREASTKRKATKDTGGSLKNVNETLSTAVKQPNQQENISQPSTSSVNNTTNQQSQIEIQELEKNKIFDGTKNRQNNWISNIELQNPDSLDTEEIQMPEIHENDHSWYVLDLCNDFSHIFVPIQREIVSLDRIQRLIALSIEKQKVIRIQFLKRACFDAFIVPSSKRKIYFGPFPLNVEPPLLVLLQSVDGKMMTREAYQQLHKIQRKSTQTTSFWLKQINGKICFDARIVPELESEPLSNEIENSESQLIANSIQTTNSNVTTLNEDCEDDCIIIEDTSDPLKQTDKSNLPSLSQHLKEVDTILKQTKFLDQSSQAAANQYDTLPTPENCTNFDIETLITRNELKSIVLDGSKKTNESIQPIENLKKDLVEQKINYNKQPSSIPAQTDCKSLNKKSGIASSPSTVQMGSMKSMASTIITNVATTTKISSFPSVTNVDQLPKVVVNSTTAKDLERTVIITNRPADNNCHPTSTVTANKLLNKTPISLQSITAKGVSSYVSASSNLTRTITKTTAATAATSMPSTFKTGTIITISPSLKGASDNILKTSVTEAPTLATVPQSVLSTSTTTSTSKAITTLSPNNERSTTSNRLSSGIIRIPQNTMNSAKIVKSPTSTESVQNSSSSPIYKLVKKPTTKLQQSAMINSKTTTNIAAQNKTTATVTDVTKIPLNIYRTTQTKANSPDVAPWPIKLNSVQPKKIIAKPQSTAATSFLNPIPILNSPEKINHNDDKIKSSLSLNPSTTEVSNNTPIEPVYGYLCSNVAGVPRFLAKRTQFEYLIKVPGFGLAKANGIVKTNHFLNKHVAKHFPHINKKHVWTFVRQMYGNAAQKTATTHKTPEIDREKTKAAPVAIRRSTSISTSSTKFTLKPLTQQKTEKNLSLKQLLSNVNETILIDDDD